MTKEPKGYVNWADGPPPDELKDGRDILVKTNVDTEIVQFWKNTWTTIDSCAVPHDKIIKHARLD